MGEQGNPTLESEWNQQINGLVQQSCNFSVLAVELQVFLTLTHRNSENNNIHQIKQEHNTTVCIFLAAYWTEAHNISMG